MQGRRFSAFLKSPSPSAPQVGTAAAPATAAGAKIEPQPAPVAPAPVVAAAASSAAPEAVVPIPGPDLSGLRPIPGEDFVDPVRTRSGALSWDRGFEPKTQGVAYVTGGSGGGGGGRLPLVHPHFETTIPPEQAIRVPPNKLPPSSMLTGLLSTTTSPQGNNFRRMAPGRSASFGNAVERALAESSAGTGLLIHTGDIRPAPLGGADFVGAPGTPYKGLQIQITTEPGYWTHVDAAPADTIWGLYPSFKP